MHISIYQIISLILIVAILYGIKLMSSPQTAVQGNSIGAISMLIAVILVLATNKIITFPLLWVAIALGSLLGYYLAIKVAMIQMPQLVSLLNGLGGGASALVALAIIFDNYAHMEPFARFSSLLALVVGSITLSGSLIAALKLDRRLSQKPLKVKGHNLLTTACLLLLGLLCISGTAVVNPNPLLALTIALVGISLAYGMLFALRVGGADMPITISLLNSYSGLAAAICGLAIADLLLVSVGAIVGASGIILTQIMCKAMNRSLKEVLNGSTSSQNSSAVKVKTDKEEAPNQIERGPKEKQDIKSILQASKKVVMVPGYGMALAQAQEQAKRLADTLEAQGKEVSFAIHPVAGRMPGHMNVLLAEVDVPYEQLKEMDEINPEFKKTDVVIVIGACDVVNPAAITAEGTPIYGMPILRVDEAKNVLVCNLDTKPGYSGVENTLYEEPNTYLLLGDAAATLEDLIAKVS
jgi:NAD(P) transhydrogenase subunit beta